MTLFEPGVPEPDGAFDPIVFHDEGIGDAPLLHDLNGPVHRIVFSNCRLLFRRSGAHCQYPAAVDVLNKVGNVVAGRLKNDFLGCTDLNQDAVLHDADMIAKRQRLTKIMGYKENGFGILLLQFFFSSARTSSSSM